MDRPKIDLKKYTESMSGPVNSIHITKPEEMSSGLEKLNEAIRKFEEKFSIKKLSGEIDKKFYYLMISGEYNRETCDEIQRIYTEAGWIDVVCKTHAELDKIGETTTLKLYLPKVFPIPKSFGIDIYPPNNQTKMTEKSEKSFPDKSQN